MANKNTNKYELDSRVNLKYIAKVMDLWNNAIDYYGYETDTLKYTYTTKDGLEGSLHMLVYKDKEIPFMTKEARTDFVDISSAFFLLKSVKPLDRSLMRVLNKLHRKYMERKQMNEGR